MKNLKVSFIGGGNMASALIKGMLQQGMEAANILVIETDAEKRAALQQNFAVRTSDQLPSVAQSDVIVLAVKPQQLRDLSIFLGSLLNQQLIISIAAGIRSQDLSRWLGGYSNIVRTMPNTPAQIQAGMTALYAMPHVSAENQQFAEHLMRAAGEVLWLKDESQMDAVTAISGSGPAYIFYFLEAMQEAALALGLSSDAAKALSMHTFTGASQLAALSTENPATLRAQVTSKAGTTERAIQTMEANHVKAHIVAAIQAAASRSKELGDQLGGE